MRYVHTWHLVCPKLRLEMVIIAVNIYGHKAPVNCPRFFCTVVKSAESKWDQNSKEIRTKDNSSA